MTDGLTGVNPVTRVSDMSGGRVDLINKLLLPPDAGKFMTAVTAKWSFPLFER